MNVTQTQAAKADQSFESMSSESPWPPAVAQALANAEVELQAGRTKQAHEILRRADVASPWVVNALGVCQLRQGQAQAAVDTFRRLAVGDHLRLRSDAPIKVNFATALLLSGNIAGCFSTLDEIGPERHPAIERLRAALTRWKQNMSFWERINWYLGSEPNRAVILDLPGDLR